MMSLGRSFLFALVAFFSFGIAWTGCGPTTTPKEPTSEPRQIADAGTSDNSPDAGKADTGNNDSTGTPDAGTPKDTTTPETTQEQKTPTNTSWYRDILPLFQKHCLGCHSEGGIGPFKLDNHKDAKAKAALIKWSVENRRMPPWMPDQTGLPLRGVRRMSAQEIKLVADWIAEGSPIGDIADKPTTPPPPNHLDPKDPNVSEVGPDKAYLPTQRTNRDDYHCLVVDPKLTKGRDLIGFEVVPGAKDLVHHVLIYPADLKDARSKETAPGEGYPCYGGPGTKPVANVVRLIGGWVPGTTVTNFPQGTGMAMPAGIGLVMQIHYNFDKSTTTPDLTKIRLKFSPNPVAKQIRITSLAQNTVRDPKTKQPTGGLWIKPGETNKLVERTVTSGPATIWGVIPHMHALGTKFQVLVEQAGKPTTVINIPRWDFNWQQSYFFQNKDGFSIGRNTKVTLRCWYTNTTSKDVTWGENTSDEMCLNYFYISSR